MTFMSESNKQEEAAHRHRWCGALVSENAKLTEFHTLDVSGILPVGGGSPQADDEIRTFCSWPSFTSLLHTKDAP